MNEKKYILKQKSDFLFNLKIKGDSKPLYKVLLKEVTNGYYDSETSSIYFSSENILLLKDYLKKNKQSTHNKCIKMIHDLTRQIVSLKSLGYSYYGFDIDDILVLNNCDFVFVSSKYLLPVIDEEICFNSLIDIPYFSNPEILELTKLPEKITYKCCYYSLGVLVVLFLLDDYLLVANEIKNEDEIEEKLRILHNTKLYYFLKRCFYKESKKRVLLLI